MTRSGDRILCWLFRQSTGATWLIVNSPVQVVSLEIDRCSIAIDAIWMHVQLLIKLLRDIP